VPTFGVVPFVLQVMSTDRASENVREQGGSSRRPLAAVGHQSSAAGDTVEEPESEIARCVRTEYARLVRVVTIVAGSVELAEDAVQEAFARAWERSEQGQEFIHLPGWITTVALNESRSRHRRRSTEGRAVDRWRARPEASERLDPEHAHEAEQVRVALDALPRRQRDVVVLHYLMDLDVATTARLLRVSQSTVKSALDRARQKLAVSLRAEMRNTDDRR